MFDGFINGFKCCCAFSMIVFICMHYVIFIPFLFFSKPQKNSRNQIATLLRLSLTKSVTWGMPRSLLHPQGDPPATGPVHKDHYTVLMTHPTTRRTIFAAAVRTRHLPPDRTTKTDYLSSWSDK